MTTSIPLPAALPLDSTSWEQTPPIVRQVVVHLLAVIEQQAGRIAALEARLSRTPATPTVPPRPIHHMRNGRPNLASRADRVLSQGIPDIVKCC